jgi:hypothetical protein
MGINTQEQASNVAVANDHQAREQADNELRSQNHRRIFRDPVKGADVRGKSLKAVQFRTLATRRQRYGQCAVAPRRKKDHGLAANERGGMRAKHQSLSGKMI